MAFAGRLSVWWGAPRRPLPGTDGRVLYPVPAPSPAAWGSRPGPEGPATPLRGGSAMPTDPALGSDEVALLLPPEVYSGGEALPADLCLKMPRLMARARALEPRII